MNLGDVDRETLAHVPCARCGVHALELFLKLEARPLGTWSLAGAQLKTSATTWPYVRCDVGRGGCGAECRGRQVKR